MDAAAVQYESSLPSEEERYFQRVRLSLLGRYMHADRREFPCEIVDMSPGSMAILSSQQGHVGERIVAYVDHIGRVEGTILRQWDGGFAMSVNATERRRDKLAAKLTWLANRNVLNLQEDRRHERVVPRHRNTELRLEDGRGYPTRIIDLSLSGAAIELEVRPTVGTEVWLGDMRGRVVRHFEEGIAVEFSVEQTRDSLQKFLTGMPDG
jgi:PilZ domain